MSLTLSCTYGAETTEEATSKDSLEIAPRRDMREAPAYFLLLFSWENRRGKRQFSASGVGCKKRRGIDKFSASAA